LEKEEEGAGAMTGERGGEETGEEKGQGKVKDKEKEKGRGKGVERPSVVTHQDAKRVLLAMKAHQGMGGDGTIVYYIVQEGEVKPRQN
jgi:tRNA-splicing endonuclease subunit Sen15, fungi type